MYLLKMSRPSTNTNNKTFGYKAILYTNFAFNIHL